MNLPRNHVSRLKNVGLDRFSRFNGHWIQTNKQTDKQSIYLEERTALLCRRYVNKDWKP